MVLCQWSSVNAQYLYKISVGLFVITLKDLIKG